MVPAGIKFTWLYPTNMPHVLGASQKHRPPKCSAACQIAKPAKQGWHRHGIYEHGYWDLTLLVEAWARALIPACIYDSICFLQHIDSIHRSHIICICQIWKSHTVLISGAVVMFVQFRGLGLNLSSDSPVWCLRVLPVLARDVSSAFCLPLTFQKHACKFTEETKLPIGVNIGVNGCLSRCALRLDGGEQSRVYITSCSRSAAIGSSSTMTLIRRSLIENWVSSKFCFRSDAGEHTHTWCFIRKS